MYFEGKSENYVISDRFFQNFKDITAQSLRFRDISKPLTAYLYFPNEGVVDEDGDVFNDAYVYVGPAKDFPLIIEKEPGNPPFDASDSIISIAFANKDTSNVLTSYLPLDLDITLIDGFKGIPNIINTKSMQKSLELEAIPIIMTQLLKLLAYINSEPQVSEFQNKLEYRSPDSQKVVKRDKWKSQLKYKLIGYNWLQSPNFISDGWSVREHFRWQRHGPGLQFVKLILIAAHQKQWRDKSESRAESQTLGAAPC
jgi:hypothetical protein